MLSLLRWNTIIFLNEDLFKGGRGTGGVFYTKIDVRDFSVRALTSSKKVMEGNFFKEQALLKTK